MGTGNGNGDNGNGDVVKFRPTTLLLDLLQRQAISETQLATIISEQNEARESRRLMHKKLDGVGGDYAELKQLATTTAAEVAVLKPQVASLQAIRQNINGGLWVLGGLASIIIFAVGFVVKDLWGWLAHHVLVRWN